jgi:hypothetical protein
LIACHDLILPSLIALSSLLQDLKKQTALRLAQEQGIPAETVATTPEATKHRGGHRFRSSSSKPLTSDGSLASPPTGDVGFSSPLAEMTPNPRLVVLEEDRFGTHRAHTPNPSSSPQLYLLSVDSATEKGANSKLPHGLTVHELKEMTKARLEAEAVRVVPSRRSPYPPVSDAEAWESASVSTAASDYPDYASSLGFTSSGNHSFHAVDEVVPLTRVPSNHLPQRFPEWGENHPLYNHHAPNRRRAATLSPRVSQLAAFHSPNGPVMPLPPAPTFARGGMEDFGARDTAALTTHPSMYPPPPMHASGPQLGIPAFEANRARTASLPTILSPSHDDDHFHGGRLLFGSVSDLSCRDPPPAVAGLSDVFAAPPPSLDDVLPGFHDATTRLRASSLLDEALAGLDAAAPNPPSDLWSDSLFCGADHLSDDLASILKLTTMTDGHAPL